MKYFSRLEDILRVPLNPYEIALPDAWGAVETRMQTLLPQDYKLFVQKFGSGRIDNFLWILNPFSINPYLNLEQFLLTQTCTLAELGAYGEDVPYRCFPDLAGILPFAITDNGDVLYWITAGLPNDWAVLVNEARGPEWQQFKMPFSEFLAKVLSKEIVCGVFPDEFPSASPLFQATSVRFGAFPDCRNRIRFFPA